MDLDELMEQHGTQRVMDALLLTMRVAGIASDTEVLTRMLQHLVERRHPRGDLTPLQILRLRQLKDLEETLEAVMTTAQPAELSPLLDEMSTAVRKLFRERSWLGWGWVNQMPSDDALNALEQEMADEYITLLLKAGVLSELRGGRSVRLPVLAMTKALADSERGR